MAGRALLPLAYVQKTACYLLAGLSVRPVERRLNKLLRPAEAACLRRGGEARLFCDKVTVMVATGTSPLSIRPVAFGFPSLPWQALSGHFPGVGLHGRCLRQPVS